MSGGRHWLPPAALALAMSLGGCSFGTTLEDALSPGAEDIETVTTSRQNPDIPAGQLLFFADWYEDPKVTASDINANVMEELRAAGGTVSCQEVPSHPDSGIQVPSQDCAFTWSDGREGTYVIRGGGPVSDDMDVDAIAINLAAEYAET